MGLTRTLQQFKKYKRVECILQCIKLKWPRKASLKPRWKRLGFSLCDLIGTDHFYQYFPHIFSDTNQITSVPKMVVLTATVAWSLVSGRIRVKFNNCKVGPNRNQGPVNEQWTRLHRRALKTQASPIQINVIITIICLQKAERPRELMDNNMKMGIPQESANPRNFVVLSTETLFGSVSFPLSSSKTLTPIMNWRGWVPVRLAWPVFCAGKPGF